MRSEIVLTCPLPTKMLPIHQRVGCNWTCFTSHEGFALLICSTACAQCPLVHTFSSTHAKGSWSGLWAQPSSGAQQSSLVRRAPDSDLSSTMLSAEQSACAPTCLPLPCCFLQACKYANIYTALAPLGKAAYFCHVCLELALELDKRNLWKYCAYYKCLH